MQLLKKLLTLTSVGIPPFQQKSDKILYQLSVDGLSRQLSRDADEVLPAVARRQQAQVDGPRVRNGKLAVLLPIAPRHLGSML
jgi:hypothetical protein